MLELWGARLMELKARRDQDGLNVTTPAPPLLLSCLTLSDSLLLLRTKDKGIFVMSVAASRRRKSVLLQDGLRMSVMDPGDLLRANGA